MKIPDVLLARLPRGVDAFSAAVKRSALTMAWRRADITRLEGNSVADGRRATVAVAGRLSSAKFILDRLFDGPVRETSLGRCWLGVLPKRLAAADAAADLTIARVPIGVGDMLFGADYLRVPELVDAEIVVPADGERWPRTQSARSNQKRVARSGLTWSITYDPADFDSFYNDIYAPFVRGRFGQRGFVLPRDELRYRFAHGCLQWIKHGDEIVAGQLLEFESDQLRRVVLGLANDGKEERKLGAGAAAVLFAVECARQKGIPLVNMGASVASLTDPVLSSKRFWGAEFKPWRGASHDMLVRWPVWTSFSAHFLAEVAPFLREGDRLVALTFDPATDPFGDAALRQTVRKLWTEGLAALGIVGGEPGEIRPGIRVGANDPPIVAVTPGSSGEIRAALRQGGLET